MLLIFIMNIQANSRFRHKTPVAYEIIWMCGKYIRNYQLFLMI